VKSWIVFGLTIVGFFAPAASASPPDFLEDLSHRSFSYFLDHSDPQTGLVLDRAPFDGSTTKNSLASIAATGFGLTAFISAAENHWIDRDKARLHILTALRFLRPLKNRVHGWYYHWMDIHTGERVFNSEISSIDTSFFLAGVLTARQNFMKKWILNGCWQTIKNSSLMAGIQKQVLLNIDGMSTANLCSLTF
jgi:hypothetical protein